MMKHYPLGASHCIWAINRTINAGSYDKVMKKNVTASFCELNLNKTTGVRSLHYSGRRHVCCDLVPNKYNWTELNRINKNQKSDLEIVTKLVLHQKPPDCFYRQQIFCMKEATFLFSSSSNNLLMPKGGCLILHWVALCSYSTLGLSAASSSPSPAGQEVYAFPCNWWLSVGYCLALACVTGAWESGQFGGFEV